jgi:hypothetical protein
MPFHLQAACHPHPSRLSRSRSAPPGKILGGSRQPT